MRRPVAIVLWVAILGLLTGDVIAIRSIDDDGYSPPAAWDRRVVSLVDFVEDARGLRFDNPVDVEFLTEAEYAKELTTEEGELSEDERREVARTEGQARALGLIRSDTSVLDDLNAITSSGTLAVYDPEKKRIVIRGTELTVATRVTIAHELTHALQDQAFGLEREFDTEAGGTFFRALVEGDATRIENEYVESLSDADRQTYTSESERDVDAARDALGNVAPALVQLFSAPYVLGAPITSLIVEEKGEDALDRVFREPPESDEGLLNAAVAVSGERARRVKTPSLRDGEKADGSGDFGVVGWFVVLSSFIDPRTALTAVDGWGGDAYRGYKRGDQTCIRIAFQGDTAGDTAEMTAALHQWRAPFTEGTVQVTGDADHVELDACEPKTVPAPRAGSDKSLELPVTRLALLDELLRNGVDRGLAGCVANHFTASVPLDALDGDSEADEQQIVGLIQRIAGDCRSGRRT